MGRTEVIERARDLIAPFFASVLGGDPSLRLIDAVFSIERVIEISSLRRLLQRG
jgi:hypothetical protein